MKITDSTRKIVVAALIALALFGGYRFLRSVSSATANSRPGSSPAVSSGAGAPRAASSGGCAMMGGSSSGGGGCCGGSAPAPSSAQQSKSAVLSGGIQKISVDVSKGYYDPSSITLKAGVPTEVTFSQSGGCTGSVQSSDLGFQEDLASGPKTVKLKGLQPGVYSFACGMNMVRGTIAVR